MNSFALPRLGLCAYGVLGFPLAFAALPLYVHLPAMYGALPGVSLAAVGAVLLATRAFDAVVDPLIGRYSDRLGSRRRLVVAGLPLLAAGFFLLCRPPPGAGLLWLGSGLVITCLGLSLSSINYHAWGAEISADPHQRTRAITLREGCLLAGVLAASLLPVWLAQGTSMAQGIARMGLGFPLLLGVVALVTWYAAPLPALASRVAGPVRNLLSHPPSRRLLLIVLVSGTASAVPATLVSFYAADVLGRPDLLGAFLALYFCAAVVGLPAWLALARRRGRVLPWLLGMGLAIVSFAWAAWLGAGDVAPFAVICIVSGLGLGAELAMPPALLADQLAAHSPPLPAGAGFGWWNLVAKLNLALGAALALGLLDWAGYMPGRINVDTQRTLALIYALLPALLKCLALAVLVRARAALEAP